MDSKNLSCEQLFSQSDKIKELMTELNANSTDKVCISKRADELRAAIAVVQKQYRPKLLK